MRTKVDQWVIVDEGGLVGRYPVGTKKHVGWETIRDSEVHSRGIETVRSRDPDLDRRALESGNVKDRGD